MVSRISISNLSSRLDEFLTLSSKKVLILLGSSGTGRLTNVQNWMTKKNGSDRFPHTTNLQHGPFVAYSIKGVSVIRTYAYEFFGTSEFKDKGIDYLLPLCVLPADKYIVIVDDSASVPELNEYLVTKYKDTCEIVSVDAESRIDTDFYTSNEAKDLAKQRIEIINDKLDDIKNDCYKKLYLLTRLAVVKLEQKETHDGNITNEEISEILKQVRSINCVKEELTKVISVLLLLANRLKHSKRYNKFDDDYIKTLSTARKYAIVINDNACLSKIEKLKDEFFSEEGDDTRRMVYGELFE